MRVTGIDQAAAFRMRAWDTRACVWEDHLWWGFISASVPDAVLMVLCQTCGRTPAEALSGLPIVVPET